MNNKVLASFAVAAAVVFSAPGNATTVSIVSEDFANFGASPGTTSNPIPTLLVGSINYPFDSVANQYRSPFENTNQSQGLGYGLQYTSVQAGGTATWTVAALGVTGGSADQLSLIWGSPDSYNTITFYSGAVGSGTAVGSFTGLSLSDPTLGVGHDTVTFSTDGIGFFNYVVLTTTRNAFEFTDLEASCTECAPPPSTPLPAALPLFAGGLGTLGFFARRRKRKSIAAVAA